MNVNFLVSPLVLRIFSLKCGFFQVYWKVATSRKFQNGAQLFISSIYQQNEQFFETWSHNFKAASEEKISPEVKVTR
jgi:hypothetical protein